jgi:hypothetical protein
VEPLPHADFPGWPPTRTTEAVASENSEQGETILDQGGSGVSAIRFTGLPGSHHRQAVRPQHNGLQPLAQGASTSCIRTCRWTRWAASASSSQRIDIAAAGQPAEYVPTFRSPGTTRVQAPERQGCPNQWIVNQGSDQDVVMFTVTPPPPLPPHQVSIVYPPQLTGFQTSNKVRSLPHVESALFNLVYNTNAVYVELYEDAVWRIAIGRGTGPSAAPLDDPAAPVRTPNNVCDQGGTAANSDLCYSKNLHQWSEELQWRRAMAATCRRTWAASRALPWPIYRARRREVRHQVNQALTYSYINPMHCNPALVDLGDPQNGLPSALGTIKVLP